MELILRITREQLVSLEACAEGLALFDRLVPSGTYGTTDAATHAEMLRQVPRDFREWLGPMVVPVDGDGYGYGHGYGYAAYGGYGYGYGDGGYSGYGYGDGYGDGDGYGFDDVKP